MVPLYAVSSSLLFALTSCRQISACLCSFTPSRVPKGLACDWVASRNSSRFSCPSFIVAAVAAPSEALNTALAHPCGRAFSVCSFQSPSQALLHCPPLSFLPPPQPSSCLQHALRARKGQLTWSTCMLQDLSQTRVLLVCKQPCRVFHQETHRHRTAVQHAGLPKELI